MKMFFDTLDGPLMGHITLDLSFIIYSLWFIPQIILNLKRKNTQGLSLGMHILLCIGYLSDLIYGFGRGMQWQYRLVTSIGLISLSIQHFQFGRYGIRTKRQQISYKLLNIFLIILIIYAIFSLMYFSHSKAFLDLFGLLANCGWFCHVFPQIIKNYINKSTKGLSTSFVLLAMVLNVLDTASAWLLGWDYPNKIGAPITLIENLILLSQIVLYSKQIRPFIRLAHTYS